LNDSSPDHPNIVFISLGSNINPEQNIVKAFQWLCECCSLQRTSQIWETEPVGSSGPNFLNAAAQIESTQTIQEVKFNILRPLEERMGRIRQADKYAPRTIDLDIIVFNQQVVENNLWLLAHLAIPLSEILPTLIDRQTGLNLHQIAAQFKAKGGVKPRPDLRLTL
jgi:2-amino-4-hydroxy-6-hydroxymethyldihydropteridine diphosphokinase